MNVFKSQFNKFGHGLVKHVRHGVSIGQSVLHAVGKASNSIVKSNDAVGRYYKQGKNYFINKAKGGIFEDPLRSYLFAIEHSPLAGTIKEGRGMINDIAKEVGYQAKKASQQLAISGNSAITGINSFIVPTTTTSGQALAFVNS